MMDEHICADHSFILSFVHFIKETRYKRSAPSSYLELLPLYSSLYLPLPCNSSLTLYSSPYLVILPLPCTPSLTLNSFPYLVILTLTLYSFPNLEHLHLKLLPLTL